MAGFFVKKLWGVLREHDVDGSLAGREITVFLLRRLCPCRRN